MPICLHARVTNVTCALCAPMTRSVQTVSFPQNFGCLIVQLLFSCSSWLLYEAQMATLLENSESNSEVLQQTATTMFSSTILPVANVTEMTQNISRLFVKQAKTMSVHTGWI